jgi:alpha-ketoglutarate-dependent dioxygenase alkB family protein 2
MHSLDGNVRLFEQQFSSHFGDDVIAEVAPFLKCQLTYSKGWPARATQSHKMARFGDEGVTYSFRGTPKRVHPWLGLLEYYRDEIEKLLAWRANCCVVNTYTSDGDLFPHRDSQYIPELGENPTIVSISFGETRDFLVWELDQLGKRKMPYTAIRLAPGDMLVMENEFDAKFHHSIKPEPHRTGLRLSLTYRKHL